jgi:hypothetical protein
MTGSNPVPRLDSRWMLVGAGGGWSIRNLQWDRGFQRRGRSLASCLASMILDGAAHGTTHAGPSGCMQRRGGIASRTFGSAAMSAIDATRLSSGWTSLNIGQMWR